MSLLTNLTTSDDIENEVDSVGGAHIVESAVYPSKIGMAYLIKSTGGALGMVLTCIAPEQNEVHQTLWVTSGDAKGCKNTYLDKKEKKQYLPGFKLANSLCLLTVGKELSAMVTEEKVLNIYSPTDKKDIPTKVPVLIELLDQEILAAVQKQTVDKTAKGDDGKYHPTGETREVNEIDKFFRSSDKLTTAEIRAGAEEPVFINTWEKKWAGVTRDKSTKPAGNGASVSPFNKPATGAPTKSLFAPAATGQL